MGCGISIVSNRRLLYEHFLPSYCIMKPRIDTSVVSVCTNSWKNIIDGETELYKQWAESRNNGQSLFDTSEKGEYTFIPNKNPTENTETKENHGESDSIPELVRSIPNRDGSAVAAPPKTVLKPVVSPVVFFYDTFYHRLFVKAPELRPLFKQSLKVQGTMLVKVISTITQTLRENKSRALKKYLEDLARRHFDRGVHPEYYGVFVHCMLEAIEACMGEEFTEEVHRAWLNAFSLVLRVMVPVAVDHLLTQGYEDGMPATGGWGWSSTRDISKINKYSLSKANVLPNKSRGRSARSEKSAKYVSVRGKIGGVTDQATPDHSEDNTFSIKESAYEFVNDSENSGNALSG